MKSELASVNGIPLEDVWKILFLLFFFKTRVTAGLVVWQINFGYRDFIQNVAYFKRWVEDRLTSLRHFFFFLSKYLGRDYLMKFVQINP